MVEPTQVCSRCGARLPADQSCQELRDQMYAYTLTRGDKEFIHQHVVDAYAAQHIAKDTKPITLGAALIGLFLFVEWGYTGRQVQLEHVKLGNKMKTWPLFEATWKYAALNIMEPLNTPPGSERDDKIKEWARAVWSMWGERHTEVEALYQRLRS